MISICLVLNGLAAILRAITIDPFFFFEELQYNAMVTAIFIDDVSFYLALWLFGALTYETALDIERMLEKRK